MSESTSSLRQAVAALGLRISELLDRGTAGVDGAQAAARGFLRSMADGMGKPVAMSPSILSGGNQPLDRVTDALGLSPVEVDLLLLGGMPDEHEGYGSVLRSLHPRGEPRPTLGLAAQLFCNSPEDRYLLRQILESGPAVRSGLLTKTPVDAPFFERSLGVAENLWSVLCGVDVWPTSLRPLDTAAVLAGLADWLSSVAVRRARQTLAGDEQRLILISAETEEIALGRALALAAAAGISAVTFALGGTGAAPGSAQEETERLLALHAIARAQVPILRLAAVPDGPEPLTVPDLSAYPGPIIVCTRRGSTTLRGRRPTQHLPIERLDTAARCRLWAELLPTQPAVAPLLAARYALEPRLAAAVIADVNAAREGEILAGGIVAVSSAELLTQVADSVRIRANLGLSGGFRVVRPTVDFDDLVLPNEQVAQLREALGRLLHQGRVLDEWGFLARRAGARGVRMLFAGPPGTGKTLSAEALAAELGVDLLVVDVSRIVSKWIGETEKNLAEAFDAAERAQAVLLFDEADALFGKRTEIADAHDRYANLETAYLLARLERFEGMAVLSTNLRQNVDSAFLRRLEFVIDFVEPSLVEREALWHAHLPGNAPVAPDVDLRELAALYGVVGAVIRNAAVAAGFLAAAESSPITRHHLVRALRREYDKSGKAFPGGPGALALS